VCVRAYVQINVFDYNVYARIAEQYAQVRTRYTYAYVQRKPVKTWRWSCDADCRFSGDAPLVASDRIELLKENEKHTIIIKKVLKTEEGIINVMATNEAGQMSASARLKVTGISSILKSLRINLLLATS